MRRRTRAEVMKDREEIRRLAVSAFMKYRPGTPCTITDLYMAEPRLHEFYWTSIGCALREICLKAEGGNGHDRTRWILREDYIL